MLDWLEAALVLLLFGIVVIVILVLLGPAVGEMFSEFIAWLING